VAQKAALLEFSALAIVRNNKSPGRTKSRQDKNAKQVVRRHILLCHNSETLKKKYNFLEKVLTFRKNGLYYIMKLGRERKKKKIFS